LEGNERRALLDVRWAIKKQEAVGEALGKLYVADHFPPEAKARALELINNLKAALADRIKTLEWMDEPTKQEALKKLAAFTVKIGYPDKWRDYSGLSIARGDLIGDVKNSVVFEWNREVKRIDDAVDRYLAARTDPYERLASLMGSLTAAPGDDASVTMVAVHQIRQVVA